MAVTIKWQRWDSASYNWFGTSASDALPSLEAELDAWITAVNGNASNTGRSITKERGYADSTTANYAALVLSAGANGNSAKGYLSYGCYGFTSKRIYTGNAYTDDTSNGGYGLVSGGADDTSVSWKTSGYEANWLLVYDTTDGQEFFTFGPTFDTRDIAYEEGFNIIKMTDGEWSMFTSDGAKHCHTHYWDDATYTGWSNCSKNQAVADHDQPTLQTSRNPRRFAMYSNDGNLASDLSGTTMVYAANPLLLEKEGTSTYQYTGTRKIISDLGDGTNVYLLTTSAQGPSVLVDLRS